MSVLADETTAYCILNAHTDTGTFHFEGPEWLLSSGEGTGPLIVDLRVVRFVIPAMTTTGTIKPDKSAVATAVGYSMTERYGVVDYARMTIPSLMFQRLEAYPDFQRTIWDVFDASCTVELASGASYKPVGVYFKVLTTTDVTLPDVGVYVVETTGCDPAGPCPIPTPPRDGGTGAADVDAGSAGAGMSDAGARDAG